MFFRKKARPWHWSALTALLAARLIYGFARFFLRVAERQAMRPIDVHRGRQRKR